MGRERHLSFTHFVVLYQTYYANGDSLNLSSINRVVHLIIEKIFCRNYYQSEVHFWYPRAIVFAKTVKLVLSPFFSSQKNVGDVRSQRLLWCATADLTDRHGPWRTPEHWSLPCRHYFCHTRKLEKLQRYRTGAALEYRTLGTLEFVLYQYMEFRASILFCVFKFNMDWKTCQWCCLLCMQKQTRNTVSNTLASNGLRCKAFNLYVSSFGVMHPTV